MTTTRRIKLLRSDGRQILRIPPEFELPGEYAVIREIGNGLRIEPARARGLLDVLAELEPIAEDFPTD